MTVHVLELAIRARSLANAMALKAALAGLQDEDPTFGYRSAGEPAAYVLLGTGEAQLEFVVDRLRREFGPDLELGQPAVAFRETITRAVEYDYTHKKQTGGAGEFARVKIRFEPLAPGSGFQFENAVIGGSVPTEYVPGVEKGLRSALDTGVYAGYPTIDFKASLIDGAYHDVDSNVMTFEIASRACFREAMTKAGPQLLEPIMRVEVVTPNEYIGDVIGDLNSRRGTIHGMEQRGSHRIIVATVPFKEMFGYVNRLRGMTRGQGTFTMTFDRYAPIGGPDDFDPPGATVALRIA